MKDEKPNIIIPVDLTNPGQFFACCGLLELADRLWPGTEGWFEGKIFHLRTAGTLRTALEILVLDPPNQLLKICGTLPVKPIVAPLALAFDGGASDRLCIDFWTKIVLKRGKIEAVAAPPWNMWSGNQKSLPIWLQLRDALRTIIAGDTLSNTRPHTDKELEDLFRQTRPLTGRFGFDSTAAWNALDEGFSPNDQGMSVESSPATELLAAIGLQRFRPTVSNGRIQYWYWHSAAPPSVAAAMATGAIIQKALPYEFSIVDRGQYSAFGKAKQIQGDSRND